MVQSLNRVFNVPFFKPMKVGDLWTRSYGVHQTPIELWEQECHVWLRPTCQDGRSTWDAHLCLQCNSITGKSAPKHRALFRHHNG